jgi:DNA-binding IclR family transcriptional regulator
MSGQARILSVLNLFEDGQPVWTVEEIGRALGLSTSTAYRSVRALAKAGFLDPVTGAGYALGPAFIRYDRLLRQSDQLNLIADPVMTDLLAATSQRATVILCRRFRECVMCVHEVRGSKPDAVTSYERGVAMPLFIGATSKVILAQLPDRLLQAIYLANEKTIRSFGPSTWPEFRTHLRDIRSQGFALTDSEVRKGRIGLAAPIFRDKQVVAGISLVMMSSALGRAKIEKFIPKVIDAAATISRAIARRQYVVSR